MLFDSPQMKVMQAGLDALALQQKLILHNLANYETPGYKSLDVNFQDILSQERERGGTRFDLKATVTRDETTSLRPDGNNVNSDVESNKLYQNYVQQLYLYDKVNGQFSNLRYVLNQSAK